jgi:hypothetical protein
MEEVIIFLANEPQQCNMIFICNNLKLILFIFLIAFNFFNIEPLEQCGNG